MFLKIKNDEIKVKGRVCADGRNQCSWISKEDIFLITVFPEGLMMSFIIDAMEGQYGVTANIPGDFHKLIMTRET